MDTHDDVYRKLQHEINKLPVPFPETDTGVELRLLKHLFTPEEAEIALNLNLLPETLPRIHKRMTRNGLTISIEELEKTLDNLVTKGAILGGGLFESKGKGKQYSLSQLAVGMFECQVNRLSREYVEDFHQYFKTAFHKAFFGTRTGQMRTVPIGSSITPELCVEPYDDMKSYVKTLNDDMAVANCVCRQSSDVAGNKCRHSDIRETCLSFGDTARFVLGRGVARRISKEEALAILDRAEEAGFILQSENARAPQYICCCCSDCCHLIAGLKMFPRPAEHFQTSYLAVVDESLCNGCEECVDKCGMEAIRMQDEVCVTDLDRCLGCGVCVAACATGARTLRKKDKKHVPPQTHDTLYGKIMLERFGVVGTVKAMSKALLGRKV